MGIVIILGVLTYITYITFSSSKAASKPLIPTKENIEQLKQLEELGFNKIQNLNLGENYDIMVNFDKVRYYREKYGMRYLSKIGLQKFLKEFNFVVGSANDFIGSIPENNISEIQQNLNKIDSVKLITHFYFNNTASDYQLMFDLVDESNVTPEGQQMAKDRFGSYTRPIPWLGNCVYHDIYNGNIKYNGLPLILHYIAEPIIYYGKSMIQVLAPKEFFDLTNKDIVDNVIKQQKSKDPIVITSITDGYLILTQW